MRIKSLLLLICTTLLAACASTPTAALPTAAFSPTLPAPASQTLAPSATPPPSATHAAPNATATAHTTATPTVKPKPTPTELPPVTLAPLLTPGPLALTVDNVKQIKRLATWGKGIATSTAWSPNGTLLAIGTTLGVYIFDTRTLAQVRFFKTNDDINVIAFSPDARTLATAGTEVELWDPTRGNQTGKLEGIIPGGIFTLAYSHGGTWLAAMGAAYGGGGDPDTRLIVWRTTDSQLVRSVDSSGSGYGSTFAFSPDGREIAVESNEHLSFFKASTGEITRSLDITTDAEAVAYSADGTGVFVGVGGKNISLVSLADGRVIKSWPADVQFKFLVSPDARTLVNPDAWNQTLQESQTQFWDLSTGQTISSENRLAAMSFSSDSHKLAGIAPRGQIQLWQVPSGKLLASIPWESAATSMAFGPFAPAGHNDPWVFAVGDNQGRVAIIDPSNYNTLQTYQVTSQAIDAIAIDPSGQRVAVITRERRDPTIVVVDAATGLRLIAIDIVNQVQDGYSQPGLAFSLSGQAVAVKGDWATDAKAWDVQTGQLILQPEYQQWFLGSSLGANAQGHLMAFPVALGQYQVEDRFSGQSLASLNYDEQLGICQFTEHYALSSDNQHFALGCDIPTIPVWDVSTGQIIANFAGHHQVFGEGFEGNILDVAFSLSGDFLVSAGYDQTLRFWDVRSDRALLTLKKQSASHLLLSPDGRFLATNNNDGTYDIWGLQP
jgi:WD40 repeat protein